MSLRRIAAVVWPFLLLGLSGCDQLFQKKEVRAQELAEKKRVAGDFQAAIALYEQALDGSAKTADVHYTMAMIYDEKVKDPVSALHHFRRYLALAPDGRHAKDAKNFIKQDEFKLGTTLAKGALISQDDAVKLKNENLHLHQQIAQFRAPKPTPAPGQSAGKIPAGARTYVVQKGDTLASISRKFFKNASRAKDIQDANSATLNGTNKIKAGQSLVIPK